MPYDKHGNEKMKMTIYPKGCGVMSKVLASSTDKAKYKPLDLNKLKDKKRENISSEEALKDVIPIKWRDDVVGGNNRVLLVGKK